MKSRKPRFTRTLSSVSVLVTIAALFTLSACDTPKPPPASAAQAQRDAVTREAAIQNAQRDAAFRYAELPISRIDARRFGGYWVVEMTAANGSGLRYTISAQDGSIRQRSMFQ